MLLAWPTVVALAMIWTTANNGSVIARKTVNPLPRSSANSGAWQHATALCRPGITSSIFTMTQSALGQTQYLAASRLRAASTDASIRSHRKANAAPLQIKLLFPHDAGRMSLRHDYRVSAC